MRRIIKSGIEIFLVLLFWPQPKKDRTRCVAVDVTTRGQWRPMMTVAAWLEVYRGDPGD